MDIIIFIQSLYFTDLNAFNCQNLIGYLFQIAELVATEFFDQGDRERKELNIEPAVSMRPCW